MRVKEIDWETDGVEVELPTAVTVPSDLEEDEIADYLSDQYGWLVNGFVMEAESFGAEMKLPKLTKNQMDFLKYKTRWFMAYSAYARGQSDRYWSPEDWKDGKAEQCFTITSDGWGNDNIARRTLKSLLEKKVLYATKTNYFDYDGRIRKSPAQQVNENPDLVSKLTSVCLGLTPIGVEIIKREFARRVRDVVGWRIELTLEDGQTAYLSDMPDDIAQSIDNHIEDVKWDIRGEQFGAESLPHTLEDCKKRLGIAEEVLSMSDAVQTYNKYLLQEMGIDRYADDELDSESFGAEVLSIVNPSGRSENDDPRKLYVSIGFRDGEIYRGYVELDSEYEMDEEGYERKKAKSFGAELESGEAALRIVVSEGQLSVYHDASNHLLMRRPIYAGEWDKIMASLNAAESFGAEMDGKKLIASSYDLADGSMMVGVGTETLDVDDPDFMEMMIDEDGKIKYFTLPIGLDKWERSYRIKPTHYGKMKTQNETNESAGGDFIRTDGEGKYAESFGAEFAGYEDPISERQRYRIRKLGGRIDKAMTRSDASKYIKSLMAMPLHAETTDCSACQGWGWNEELDMVCDADGCIGGWVVPKKPSLLERGLELGAGMGMGMAGVAILFGLVGGTVGFAAETRKKRRD